MVIESTPPGATVTINDQAAGVTPLKVNTTWWPFRKIPVSIDLPGYRPFKFHAGKAVRLYHIVADILSFRMFRLFGLKARNNHHIMLIRRHGRVGSWSPEDAKKMR